MSTYPNIEARLRAQEHRQFNTEVHIEELAQEMTSQIKAVSNDLTASFKQLADYQVKTEQQINTRFDKVEARLDKIETQISDLNKDVKSLITSQQEQATLLAQILERLPKQ